MDCSKISEMYYEDDSIITSLRIWVHTLFCDSCARKISIYKNAEEVMRKEFFPESVNLENSIMARISNENSEKEPDSVPGILSTRNWIIAGLVILVSFITAYFGLEFQNIADETGISFILPVGIIFGIVLTSYCTFFIGSHLKEFTKRFGL